MRSLFRNIIKYAEQGDATKVERFFSEAQSAIDTCLKKNLIHKNNAARKKSRMAKMIAALDKKGKKVAATKVKKAVVKAKKK